MDKAVVLTSIVAALLTWIFMYIDARLFDAPKSKFTYFKVMSFVAAVCAGIVYFMGGKASTHIGGGGGQYIGRQYIGGGSGYGGGGGQYAGNIGTAMVNGIGENILTGLPDF